MSHFLSSTKEDKKQQNCELYAIFGGGYLYGVEITDRITACAGGGIHAQTGYISGTATLIINSAGFGGYSCSHNNPVPNYFGGGINMLNGDLYVTGNMLLSYGYTGGQGGGLNTQCSTINSILEQHHSTITQQYPVGGITFDGISKTVSGKVSLPPLMLIQQLTALQCK